MTNIINHCKPFPMLRFACPNCGCAYDTDEYVMRTVTEWYPSPKRNEMVSTSSTVAMVNCPECRAINTQGNTQ